MAKASKRRLENVKLSGIPDPRVDRDSAEMIPSFENNGYLPPGIHRATLDEVGARFGREAELFDRTFLADPLAK